MKFVINLTLSLFSYVQKIFNFTNTVLLLPILKALLWEKKELQRHYTEPYTNVEYVDIKDGENV